MVRFSRYWFCKLISARIFLHTVADCFSTEVFIYESVLYNLRISCKLLNPHRILTAHQSKITSRSPILYITIAMNLPQYSRCPARLESAIISRLIIVSQKVAAPELVPLYLATEIASIGIYTHIKKRKNSMRKKFAAPDDDEKKRQ